MSFFQEKYSLWTDKSLPTGGAKSKIDQSEALFTRNNGGRGLSMSWALENADVLVVFLQRRKDFEMKGEQNCKN